MLNCYIVDSLELIYQKVALINRKEIIKGKSGKYPNSQPYACMKRMQYISCNLKALEYCIKPKGNSFKTAVWF